MPIACRQLVSLWRYSRASVQRLRRAAIRRHPHGFAAICDRCGAAYGGATLVWSTVREGRSRSRRGISCLYLSKDFPRWAADCSRNARSGGGHLDSRYREEQPPANDKDPGRMPSRHGCGTAAVWCSARRGTGRRTSTCNRGWHRRGDTADHVGQPAVPQAIEQRTALSYSSSSGPGAMTWGSCGSVKTALPRAAKPACCSTDRTTRTPRPSRSTTG